MKKLLIALALLLGVAQFAQAQEAAKIIKKYKDEPEATYQNTPFKTFAQQQSAQMSEEEKAKLEEIMKQVDNVEILDFDLHSSKKIARFRKAVKRLGKKGYESMTDVKNDGVWVRAFSKAAGDIIKEIVVIVEDVEDDEFDGMEAGVYIIRATGNLKMDSLGDMLKIKIN